MFVDTHSHLNFKAFQDTREQLIQKCLNQGVWIINASSNLETSKKALEIARGSKNGVYAAVGLHPINITKENFNYNSYKKLAKSDKVVAIGETGLDYWQLPKSKPAQKQLKEKQKEILFSHIKLAQELNLPVIFHCRKAHEELIDFLKNISLNSSLKGVIHCFTGNVTELKQYLNLGFYIGFNGIIFKLNLETIIKKTPLERLLVETDCPFLPPPNFPEKPNNPLAVKIVAQKIAQIKNQSLKEIEKQTTENAQKLFGLPKN